MDFNDTPEEAAFRSEARAWLEANAEPSDPDAVAPNILSRREDPDAIAAAKVWQKKKARAGWACITWPKEHGGRGGTPIQQVIWTQEEGRFKTPPNIFAIGLGMLGPTIRVHGSEEQITRYIPNMVDGTEVWCQLFSEPGAGSDLAGLRMSASRDGDDWIINGQKIWTTGAHYADWGVVVTRTDPNVAKHAGLTYFIVDMKAPGIEIRPIRQINGGSGFNEVFFSDVRVPDANLLDRVGNGWKVAITTLMHERASIGSGSSRATFHDLFRLARDTELAGRPALSDSSVRQKLADFYITQKGLQYTSYRTLTALSRGQTPGPEASIAKLVGAPLNQRIADFACELEGATGALLDRQTAPQEAAWQDQYLSAPGLRLAGGTDEILRNIISERVLRLPPEPRLDKELAFRDIPTGPPTK